MLRTRQASQFKQEYDLMKRRGKDMEKIKNIIQMLVEGIPLPQNCRDHALKGELSGYRDCHIEPDWVLIYAVKGDELLLYRTGSHADILE
jgi:mRNA interferase YafQ